jgi:sodium bicarbonate transporter 10
MVTILISTLQVKNGTMMGDGCNTPHYVPDVFLMSVVLFFGTFVISIQLKDFKNALFFPSKVSDGRYCQ